MANAVAVYTSAVALVASAASVSGVAQKRTLSLRTLPCAAVSRRCTVSASLTPVEKNLVADVQDALASKDNQNAVAATLAGSLFGLLSNVGSAAAAQEVLSLAEADNRGYAVILILLPALGWVLFNILKPALNQLDKMKSSKGIAAAAGIGATTAALVAPEQADAAQEIAQLAADNRGYAVILILLPALGWVLFNILKPALNQLDKMKSKSVVGALGLGAAGSLLAAPHADAAQQIAQIAGDDRPGLLLLILLPAVGWVLYNILKPGLNQLKNMQGKAVVGAVGLGAAASLMAAPGAEAAQQIAQLASDDRPLLTLGVLLPALGWVLYNILKPAKNQLDNMTSSKAVVGAAGIGAASAALLAAAPADAAQEIAQLASDSRPGLVFLVLLPAIGWVLYNILKPALNQLKNMQ